MIDKHLQDHGISYFDHLKLALFISKESFLISCMACIHGLIPILFETGASDKLAAMMPEYKRRLAKAQSKYK